MFDFHSNFGKHIDLFEFRKVCFLMSSLIMAVHVQTQILLIRDDIFSGKNLIFMLVLKFSQVFKIFTLILFLLIKLRKRTEKY